MKKMVCEICGSQSIKKDNGVFVCQECGTEYSLEEAKKLLKEIEEVSSTEIFENKIDLVKKNEDLKIVDSGMDKYQAIDYLSCWLKCISIFENSYFWAGAVYGGPKEEFIKNPELITNFFASSVAGMYKMEVDKVEDFCFDHVASNSSSDINMNYLQFYDGKFPEELIREKLKDDYSVKKTLDAFEEFKYATFTNCWGNSEYKNVIYSTDGTYKKLLSDNIYTSFDLLTQLAVTNKTYKCQSKIAKGLFGSQWVDTTEDPFNLTRSIQKVRDYISAFKKRHEELIKYYENKFDEMKGIFEETYKTICDLEGKFNLPEKYRNSGIIMKLLDLFIDGRADTWKEALNIYENEIRMDALIADISQISNKLDNITKKLDDVSYQLQNINSSMNQIYSTVSTINLEARQIMYDTRWKLILG